MADVANIEVSTTEKETITEAGYPMMFADGSGFADLSIKGPKEWRMNTQTSFRENKGIVKSFNPKFDHKPENGSIIDFGEGQTYIVTAPSRAVPFAEQEKGVFVERIPPESVTNEKDKLIEGYNQIRSRYEREGKQALIMDLGTNSIPLTENSLHELTPPNSTSSEIDH